MKQVIYIDDDKLIRDWDWICFERFEDISGTNVMDYALDTIIDIIYF